MSDFKGAALMFDAIADAKTLLGDKGYDADWFRQALKARGIEPCIRYDCRFFLQDASYREKGRVYALSGRLSN